MNTPRLKFVNKLRDINQIDFSKILTNGKYFFLDCHYNVFCNECILEKECKALFEGFPVINLEEFKTLQDQYPEEFL